MGRRRGCSRTVRLLLASVAVVGGCTAGTPGPSERSPAASPTASAGTHAPRSTDSREPEPHSARDAATADASGPTSASPPAGHAPSTTPQLAFDSRAVQADIERLATDIGPREATSGNFDKAADLVEDRFEDLGYAVATERVDVPAGHSWGTPVRSGTSRNVLAEAKEFDAHDPHVVVVAHLDTVAVAPGAEDNASGISVMLELARLAASAPPAVPVRFIAFGAEEPRGRGDALHHFGSQQHVADLSRAEREAIEAVVALDRVGVRSAAVPVCSALPSGDRLRAELRAAGAQADVPTRGCTGNTTSDHWSYAKAGVAAIRLGSVPYAAYHSPADTPQVVDRRQLQRVGELMWAWLRSLD